jgi:hypothetical protein
MTLLSWIKHHSSTLLYPSLGNLGHHLYTIFETIGNPFICSRCPGQADAQAH